MGLLLLVLWRQKPALQRTSFAEHRLTLFKDAGLQMEIPTHTPFVSGNASGVLIMIHRMSRKLQGEADYLIKLPVSRKSNSSMELRKEFASQTSPDQLQKWRYKLHSRLDVRKEPTIWYVCKDIETPGGDFLCADAEINVTESIEDDLSETQRIIESIRPLR